MVGRLRTTCWTGLVAGCLAASMQAQSSPAQTAVTPVTGGLATHRPQEFAGAWAYNASESINAATGRPERVPRGPAPRTPASTGNTGATVTPGVPPSAMGPVAGPMASTVPSSAFGFDRPGDLGPTVAMIQENRSLTRDLLEIPETLIINVEPQAVTFTDDLERARTYPVTGERRKYQLGAARFNAATFWVDSRLEKKIDAADGFRMTETYVLNETARRLFVLLRVGSSRKGAPVMGVNRVYDRLGQ